MAKSNKVKRKQDAPLGDTGVRINSGKDGPITVAHRFHWKNVDPRLLKLCIQHTRVTNNGEFLRTETDSGPNWTMHTIWVRSPDGVEYAVTCDPSMPRHFTISTAHELEAYRAEMADDERFSTDAARFDSLPAKVPA